MIAFNARFGPIPLRLAYLGGAPRERSCACRERGDRLGFRAVARGVSGCRRSYARSGPFPLPPVCAWVGWLRGVDAWGRSISVRSFGGRRFGCGGRRRTDPGGTWVFSESPDSEGGVGGTLLELLALSPANHRPDLEPEVSGIVDGLPIVVSVIHPSGSTGVH